MGTELHEVQPEWFTISAQEQSHFRLKGELRMAHVIDRRSGLDSDEDEEAKKREFAPEAEKLLKTPNFFRRFLDDVEKSGLIGESQNALALYIVATSRLRDRPLCAFIKGRSSAGKNYLGR